MTDQQRVRQNVMRFIRASGSGTKQAQRALLPPGQAMYGYQPPQRRSSVLGGLLRGAGYLGAAGLGAYGLWRLYQYLQKQRPVADLSGVEDPSAEQYAEGLAEAGFSPDVARSRGRSARYGEWGRYGQDVKDVLSDSALGDFYRTTRYALTGEGSPPTD